MLKIGLTGGIGSGKSTVAEFFADLGAPVVDADVIARNLVEPGSPALSAIEKQFGDRVVGRNGRLDRARLKKIIFSDPGRKKALEDILHPLVFREIRKILGKLHAPYVVLCIPLLVETKMESFVDRILVVDCPEQMQKERVKKRDRLTEQDISAIIESQAPRSRRLAAANDVIENTGNRLQLADQVKKLHNLYLSISASTSGRNNL
ncbi:MAG: dephospho-CoA kinase [Gammaproteobacteria bacterium]